MKSVKQWFSLGPYDEYEGRKQHWYNRYWEHDWTYVRLMYGDLLAGDEVEHGGDRGPQLSFELNIAQADIPEFYIPDNPNARYDIHYLSFIIWRWGVYVSVRGRIYA